MILCAYSEYVDAWFRRNAGVHKLADYLGLIEQVRNEQFPVEMKFAFDHKAEHWAGLDVDKIYRRYFKAYLCGK